MSPKMPPGYVPKTSRPKHPLTVEQQRRLCKLAEDEGGEPEALLLLMLSTGMHPKVLTKEGQAHFSMTQDYCAWTRPKNRNPVHLAWSAAMRDRDVLKRLRKAMGSTRQWYFVQVRDLGRRARIEGLCPLQLRHTCFVNRARLGHNAFDIAMSMGTDLDTVYRFYMIGAGEGKRLTSEDRAFLERLMEP